MPKIENNFNDLSPKIWLPFQKSFTLFHNKNTLVRDNLRFFTKPSIEPKPVVSAYGHESFYTTVQEQWLAPRIHYGLRLTRSEAANPEIWNYLALKFDTYYK